jgi:hypothetical protein
LKGEQYNSYGKAIKHKARLSVIQPNCQQLVVDVVFISRKRRASFHCAQYENAQGVD